MRSDRRSVNHLRSRDYCPWVALMKDSTFTFYDVYYVKYLKSIEVYQGVSDLASAGAITKDRVARPTAMRSGRY